MKRIKILMMLMIVLSLTLTTNIFAAGLELTSLDGSSFSSDEIVSEKTNDFDFKVTFTGENQTAIYKGKITNTSKSLITVKSLAISQSRSEVLEYKLGGINEGDTLAAGESKEISIEILFGNKLDKSIEEEFSLRIGYENDEVLTNPETGIFSVSKTIIPIVLSLTIVFFIIKKKYRMFKTFSIFIVLGLLASIVPIVKAANTDALIIRGMVKYRTKYTVTINPNSGSYNGNTDYITLKILDGDSITLSIPVKEYYDFDNWTINGQITTSNKITITGNTTIEANYKPIYYTVTIDPNSGTYDNSTSIKTYSVQAGTYYTVKPVTNGANELLKWEINPSDKEIVDDKIFVDSNISLKALWNNLYVTLTINPNGGTYNGFNTNYITYYLIEDSEVVTLLNASKLGSTFTGWKLEDGSDYSSSSVTMNENITLIAQYEPIIYNVTINPNGGTYNGVEQVLAEQVLYDHTYDLTLVERDGYLFEGWEDSEGNIIEEDELVVHDNVSIHANWSEIICRIGETYYASIMDAINAANFDDTIVLLKDTEEIVTNNKKVTLDLNDHTVTGQLTNTSSGDITLINGTIENTSGTALINNGTLTMGINDLKEDGTSNVVNDSIIIIGTDMGFVQNGTFNFYDGYIEGNIALVGGYNDAPYYRNTFDDKIVYYYPFVNHNNIKDCQRVMLEASDLAVSKTTVHGDIYYYNLQDNINTSSVTGYTIYAVRDFEAAYKLSVQESKTINFDLDHNKVVIGNIITNDGTLNIYDDTDKEGKLTLKNTLTNNGKLNIKDINIDISTDFDLIDNNNDLDIKNSTLTALQGYAVKLNLGSTFKIDNDTTLESDKYALYVAPSEEVTLNKGNIFGIYNDGITTLSTTVSNNGSNYAINNTNNAKLTINEGATINGDNYCIYNNGELVMNGGSINYTGNYYHAIYTNKLATFNGGTIYTSKAVGLLHAGGTTVINNATFDTQTTCVETYGSGEITFNDGTYTSRGGDALNLGTYYNGPHIFNGGTYRGKNAISENGHCTNIWCSYPNGSITINDGDFYGTQYGINNIYATIKINGGTIKGDTYGIYNKKNVILGEDDNIFIKEPPVISGGTYGLYSEGLDEFYDGTLKGTTSAYFGNFSKVADSAKIITTTETISGLEYEKKYLVVRENFLRVGTVEYNSLVDAINAIETEGTIEVILSTSYGYNATIPAEKNIIFDLNGHTLEMGQTITNDGQFTITDSVGNGKIITPVNRVITNNTGATLTIDGGTLSSSINNEYTVYNKGTLTINEGRIEQNSENIYSTAIYNSSVLTINDAEIYTLKGDGILHAGGTTIINNGDFDTDRNCIYTYGFGTMEIYDGSYISRSLDALNLGCYYGGEHKIYGGTFRGKNGIAENPYCTGLWCDNPSGIVRIYGGDIHGTQYGINNPYATIYAYDGKISGDTYGINNTKNVVLGIDDENISNTSPEIIGSTYGLYSTGKASLYDGILKGTEAGFNKPFDLTADATVIRSGTETIDGIEYVTNYLELEDNFLRVGDTEYNSLVKAIEAIETEGTIEVLASTSYGYPVTIPTEKTITFELNGQVLNMAQPITVDGVLTVQDSVGNGKLNTTQSRSIVGGKNSTITINSGTISSEAPNEYTIYTEGIILINGGTISQNSTQSSQYCIYSSKSLTIENATLTSVNGGGIVHAGGTTVINDINIDVEKTGIYTYGHGTIDIYDGVYSSRKEDALNLGNYYSGTQKIYGGTFTGKNAISTNGYCTGWFCDNPGGDIHVIGGTFEGTQYGINNTVSRMWIEGGTITGDTYGIYNTKKLYIGINDENINTTSPRITGSTYGLYSTGTVEFYDGILRGTTDGYFGTINEIPSLATIVQNIENETIEKYIEIIPEFVENTNSGERYNNLEEAINSTNENDILSIIKDAHVFDKTEIESDKVVTIDLNGHNMKFNKTITNNGSLTMINSVGNDISITSTANSTLIDNKNALIIKDMNWTSEISPYLFTNNGSLSIENSNMEVINGIKNETVDSTLILNNVNINAKTIAINNNGIMNIKDSELRSYDTSTSYNVYTIYDSGSNTSTIKDTKLNSDINFGIHLQADGTININHAEINGKVKTNVSTGNIYIDESTITNQIINAGNITIKDSIYTFDVSKWFSSGFAILDSTGYTNIINSKLSASKTYQYGTEYRMIKNTGTLLFDDLSTIDMSSQNTYGTIYGIQNTGDVTFDGKITTTNGETAYGIHTNGGSVLIKKGMIETINAKTEYGIYIQSGSVTLGIPEDPSSVNYGTQHADVSLTDPSIKAVGINTGIGVKNINGQLNYYDGIITGSTSSKPEVAADIEYLYEAIDHIDEETGYKYCVLEWMRPQNGD